MELRQTLNKPVNGYWDGGAKQVFNWSIESVHEDSKGKFVKIGSWEANYWFHVAHGRTDKQTLSYAKMHLRAHTRYPGTFEYVC